MAAPELKARLLERNQELLDAGYHAQVHLEPNTSLFFLLEKGDRVPLRRKDTEFGDLRDAGGGSLSQRLTASGDAGLPAAHGRLCRRPG